MTLVTMQLNSRQLATVVYLACFAVAYSLTTEILSVTRRAQINTLVESLPCLTTGGLSRRPETS